MFIIYIDRLAEELKGFRIVFLKRSWITVSPKINEDYPKMGQSSLILGEARCNLSHLTS
jgi:hypothetical protein